MSVGLHYCNLMLHPFGFVLSIHVQLSDHHTITGSKLLLQNSMIGCGCIRLDAQRLYWDRIACWWNRQTFANQPKMLEAFKQLPASDQKITCYKIDWIISHRDAAASELTSDIWTSLNSVFSGQAPGMYMCQCMCVASSIKICHIQAYLMVLGNRRLDNSLC